MHIPEIPVIVWEGDVKIVPIALEFREVSSMVERCVSSLDGLKE